MTAATTTASTAQDQTTRLSDLPQHPTTTYRYIRGDDPASIQQLLHHNKGECHDDDFQVSQLVWVCKSKGRGRGQLELFLRARVLETNLPENRVRVQYPKGSTYAVHREYLVPVLEHNEHVVIVLPETHPYRRTCIVHTLENEFFLEIGCDAGTTCQRVWETGSTGSDRMVCGIDKSSQSIAEAQSRHPGLPFYQWDILEDCLDDMPTRLREHSRPSIVAIDINGNRVLAAVLDCLRIVLTTWEPRLIIVKSRTLHHVLVENETE